ncbi:MAG: membrane protein insertase YidC [Deltaproteobacteria bacterium]|nr:membrane protein insertase YidC [Deltaproteobacteria bacterium]
MDNKRALLAVVLSLAVLLAWNWLFPPQHPAPDPGTTSVATMEQPPSQAIPPDAETSISDTASQLFTPTEGRTVRVETPLYQAEFSSTGGILEHFTLTEYRETIAPGASPIDLVSSTAMSKAPMGISWQKTGTWKHGEWSFQGSDLKLNGAEDSGSLIFNGRIGDFMLVRTLSFSGQTYLIKERLAISNTGGNPLSGVLGFNLAASDFSAQPNPYNLPRIAYLTATSLKDESDLDDLKIGISPLEPVQWGAIESNYFMAAMVPESGTMGLKAKFEDETFRLVLEKEIALAPNQAMEMTNAYYFGPKTETDLVVAPSDLGRAINYGFFNVIAQPLITFLNFLYKFVHNYGVAIIILTIIIKIIFWPLSQKSYKSMEQMKRLQPIMAQIREKYKDDRQRMNTELMQLYKTYKVNPLGGCLPMLLQIPVFFALYQALLGAIELRHAPFISNLPFTDIVWLADLSAKDPLYVTPLIMGATMFLQQKMTPMPGDPLQAKIMLFMPIIFTFIFLNFPSGLVVYWTVNNLLSIAQQWLMIRKVKTS